MYFSLGNVGNMGALPTASIVVAGALVTGALSATSNYFKARALDLGDPKSAAVYHGGGSATGIISAAVTFELTSVCVSSVFTHVFPPGGNGPLYGWALGMCIAAPTALAVGVGVKFIGGKVISDLVNHPVSWTYAGRAFHNFLLEAVD